MATAAPASATTSHNPVGRLSVTMSGQTLHATGTASDPDTTHPITVMIVIDGRRVALPVASIGGHGFSYTQTLPVGRHVVSARALNVGLGTTVVFGEIAVNSVNPVAAANPRGYARFLQSGSVVRVVGLALDPSAPTSPLTIGVYRNGVRVAVVRTIPSNHYYSVNIGLGQGTNRLVAIGYNIGSGTANTTLGTDTAIASWTTAYTGVYSIAANMFARYGWAQTQMPPLIALWNRESGWRTNAANPSGAYGIPQALPGSKMASAGPNWQTSATTQIAWGLGYIRGTYGTPAAAWAHSQAYGWY
jgi:hypothetical protein